MIKTLRVVAATVALLALATVDASPLASTKAPANDSMSVGDGTNVKSSNKTTVFLGTEYNANRCVLQFNSLQCKVGKDDDCGQLNGYQLECVTLDSRKGREKNQCQCRANETDVCQNSTISTAGGVPQFGDCSNNRPCVDSYGHVPTKLELKVCAEKIHCVKEINTTATVPAEICHTCRSCIAQNDANGAQLSDKRRFDCTKICPKEILDSIAKRNEQGVGIADEVSSASQDEEEGSTEDGSTEEELNATQAPAGSKKGGSAAASLSLSATALVGSIVAASLSAAVLL